MKKIIKKIATAILAGTIMFTNSIVSYAEDNEVVITNDEYCITETIYFDNLVLTLDETTANYTDSNLAIAGDTCYTSLPAMYWGAYNSSDNKYYLQINGGTSIAFRGKTETGLEILCHHDNVTAVSLTPAASNNNFTVNYSQYIRINDSTVVIGDFKIIGKYLSTSRQFVINSITFYRQ